MYAIRSYYAEPLLHRNLLAKDGNATGVNVVLQYPEKSEAEVPEAVTVARHVITSYSIHYTKLYE